jgi:hypothetical protein
VSEYVILDARAHDDPDAATVLVWCKDLAEALDYRADFPGGVLAKCPDGDGPLVVVPWPKEAPRG